MQTWSIFIGEIPEPGLKHTKLLKENLKWWHYFLLNFQFAKKIANIIEIKPIANLKVIASLSIKYPSKMADSGCKGVKLGVESGSQKVVDKIVNKHLDLKYLSEIVSHIRSLNMSVHGTFTYGLPGETKDDMIKTKKFIQDTKFSTVQESGTAEIEGTPLHALINEQKLSTYPGAIADENYDRQKDGGKKWQSLVKELQND